MKQGREPSVGLRVSLGQVEVAGDPSDTCDAASFKFESNEVAVRVYRLVDAALRS